MNFILLNYKNNYSGKLKNYYENNNLFFKLTIKQIVNLHPEAKIHVITNFEQESIKNVKFYYYKNLECNNYAKIKCLDLLEEPAIFVDNDVIILKKFDNMPNVEYFNLFQEYKDYSTLPLHMQKYKHYNTGVIWIKNPCKKLTKEIYNVCDKFKIHKNGWVNDEYPISFIINKLNLNMQISNKINQYRSNLNNIKDILNCQSVHYTGSKENYLNDFSFIKIKNL